jgi:hypothetical protein
MKEDLREKFNELSDYDKMYVTLELHKIYYEIIRDIIYKGEIENETTKLLR